MNLPLSATLVFVPRILSCCLVFVVFSGAELCAQDTTAGADREIFQKPAWLKGSGADMRIRIEGEVLSEDGQPLADFEFSAVQELAHENNPLNADLKGHRFSFWVPLGKQQWFNVELKATTKDSGRVAMRTIADFQIRQVAIDGVELRVQGTQRTVSVRVLHKQQPVPQAIVTAELQAGSTVSAIADAQGVAALKLMSRDRLQQLTARTNDFRIGGFAFHRDPPRDTAGSEFTIDIEQCRRQTVRLVDSKSGKAIPDLGFYLTVGTGPPDYQFLGRTPDSQLQTNQNGEAIYRWFPDWKQHGSYASVFSNRWVTSGPARTIDGVIEFPFKQSKFAERKRVAGRIESATHNPAGVCLTISSFQAEKEGSIDVMRAVADENGIFEANYLPGSTYCVSVHDTRLASRIIDLIPWEPESKKVSEPVLTLEGGLPVEVIVTSGPRKRPIPYHFVQMQTEHSYRWMENGESRSGSGSRRWWVMTNKFGRAFTYSLANHTVEGSVYSPEWRAKESIEVTKEGPNRLRLHRDVATPRTVFGRLIPPENVACDLAGAVIEIGAVDGETKERLSVTANADGTYSFVSKSLQVGIFVRTIDGKAAAGAAHLDLEESADVQLLPAVEFRGQLVDEENQPIALHRVYAVVRVFGERKRNMGFGTFADSTPIEATTDDEGNFTIPHLPPDVEFRLRAAALDGSKNDPQLADIRIKPDEDQVRRILRFPSKDAN